MTNPLVSAIPNTGTGSYQTVRQNLALTVALPLKDAAAVAEFHAWDLAVEATPYPAVIYAGTVYEYDADDSLTAHDPPNGCIIDASGRRYKRQAAVKPDHFVLDKDLTAPPGSPAEGDSYYIATAATGDWAGKDGLVAIFGAHGWHYRTPGEGDQFYVADEPAYYHLNASLELVKGFGDLALADASIGVEKLKSPFGFSVEAEQADPPGSVPAADTAYIVGVSATGLWAGEDTKIAISNGTSYDFRTPAEGSFLYDKGAGTFKTFDNGVWNSSAGKVVQAIPVSIDTTYTGGGISGVVYNKKTFTITGRAGDVVAFQFPTFELRLWRNGSDRTYVSGTAHLKRDEETANVVDIFPGGVPGPFNSSTQVSMWSLGSLGAIDVLPDGDPHDYHFGWKIVLDSNAAIDYMYLHCVGTIFILRANEVEGA